MPTETLTKPAQPSSSAIVRFEDDELRSATQRQLRRARRLKINVEAWGLGATVLTAVWVVHEWQANGAFERFAHEGNSGDWNPTLWALAVLTWGLVVGIMALRVHFERPPTAAEVDRGIKRLKRAAGVVENASADARLRRLARTRIERLGRLKFQVAAWLLAMVVLAPLNALIEWQDNGGFQRVSRNSQPGSWDPWILYVGGVWALVIVVLFALPVYLDRRRSEAEVTSDVTRLTPSG